MYFGMYCTISRLTKKTREKLLPVAVTLCLIGVTSSVIRSEEEEEEEEVKFINYDHRTDTALFFKNESFTFRRRRRNLYRSGVAYNISKSKFKNKF